MTAHDQELAPLIRGVFLPEEARFGRNVHYAAAQGLRKARRPPSATHRPQHGFPPTGFRLDRTERSSAKNTNFAKAFGAGVGKFAAMIGKPEDEARDFHSSAACRALPRRCQAGLPRALRWGASALGRLGGTDRLTEGMGPCSREAEPRVADPDHPWYRRWLRRAETHKAMNALIQGSAARHTKLWMRSCWQGIVPLLHA
jgi:hypothetical protein